MKSREARGFEIARNGMVRETPKGWLVQSQSKNSSYLVYGRGMDKKCNCPDYEMRGRKCKHQYAVEYFLKKSIDTDGNTTFTKTIRMSYPQDWRAYNTSQKAEIRLFDVLLKDLVANVEEPMQTMGRPRLSLRESVFCGIQKVYSQLSSRRAYSLYENAQERSQIERVPNYNAINKVLGREDLTPILQKLLVVSALPLKSVETTFASDSSGFRTSQFNQYAVEKYGAKREHKWIKAHILVGTKTNVIVNAKLTDENGADCPQFKPLVMEAHEHGFEMNEIVADMGYSSRENYNTAKSIGATAYIPFKRNATGKAGGSFMWSKMFRYFQWRREEFMSHYHARSNVETVFMMVKAKFGDKFKSKKKTAQINEMLCKFIAHNIVVLIHEMHELGMAPSFSALRGD